MYVFFLDLLFSKIFLPNQKHKKINTRANENHTGQLYLFNNNNKKKMVLVVQKRANLNIYLLYVVANPCVFYRNLQVKLKFIFQKKIIYCKKYIYINKKYYLLFRFRQQKERSCFFLSLSLFFFISTFFIIIKITIIMIPFGLRVF